MAIEIRQGSHPHIGWIDVRQNGVFIECAIMRRDRNGNVFYFPIKWLDDIDKRRIYQIITNRNARSFELWDLCSQITLNNGVNALVYFHQLVRQLTASGQVITPGLGQSGSADWDTRARSQTDATIDPKMIAEAAAKAAGDAAAAAAIAAYNYVAPTAVPVAPVAPVAEAAPEVAKKKTKKS